MNTSKNFSIVSPRICVFYKGTALLYPKEWFQIVWTEAKKSNFLEQVTPKELLDQLDIMEEAVTTNYKKKGWGYAKDVFKTVLPDQDPSVGIVLWFLNIVCLIQRGVLKNDNMNGFLFNRK